MSINNIPGAVWPVIYGAIYLGLQTFVAAQWPDTPPAAVLGIMAALGVAQGLFKVFGPQPAAPASADQAEYPQPPPGVQAQAGMVAPAQPEPSKVVRFLI